MLRFDESSLFYKHNAELIRQFHQTEHLLAKRDKPSPESGKKDKPTHFTNQGSKQITAKIRSNLKAQAASLLSKALTKQGDDYIYLDFLAANLNAFEEIFNQDKIKSKEDLHALSQIKELKNYYLANQKSIFQTAHIRSLNHHDILACGPYINLLYASDHDEEKNLYKYDSLLHYVVRLGDAESVKVLLKSGFNVDCYKPDYSYKDKKKLTVNTTPLGVAIASDNTLVARILLEAGASIDKDEFRTALNKHKITNAIRSDDMRSLLIEFSLARMYEDPFNSAYTFNEQVLIAANRHMRDELDELNRKVDSLANNQHKRTTPPGANTLGFFAGTDQPEDDIDRDRVSKKRNISDID